MTCRKPKASTALNMETGVCLIYSLFETEIIIFRQVLSPKNLTTTIGILIHGKQAYWKIQYETTETFK